MMAPGPTGGAHWVSAERKPAVKLAWMAPAERVQPQNIGSNDGKVVDAQLGKVKPEGGLPGNFPAPRADGQYLLPDMRFVSAAEDMRRLGNRIPLHRIFSLRHSTTAHK
jgi:hypothetical protein